MKLFYIEKCQLLFNHDCNVPTMPYTTGRKIKCERSGDANGGSAAHIVYKKNTGLWALLKDTTIGGGTVKRVHTVFLSPRLLLSTTEIFLDMSIILTLTTKSDISTSTSNNT